MHSEFEHVSGFGQTVSIEEASKLTGFPGGEHKFYKWLRAKKFILDNRLPSQRMIDLDYFKVFNNLDQVTDDSHFTYGPRVRIKGLRYLSQLVAKEFPQCPPCTETQKNNNI